MQRLTHIDPFSAARMHAIISAVVTLVFTVLGSLLALVTPYWGLFGLIAIDLGDGVGMLFLGLVLQPICAAVGGYLGGLLFAGVYNWAALRWGGVRLRLE